MDKNDTRFRQKSCLSCKSNHDNEGTLCQFCLDRLRQKQARQRPHPDSFWVECLIARDGDTTAHVNGRHYLFTPNDAGHVVCEVVNADHYRAFTERMGGLFRPYRPEVDYRQQIQPEQPGLLGEVTDHDGAGADNREADQAADRDNSGLERTGGGKRSSKGDRAGATTATV